MLKPVNQDVNRTEQLRNKMAKILIAEDEPDIRELITFTLKYAGHEVVVTSNGEEALEKIAIEKPDLVLLDVRMPRLSGYETCRQIKADPNLSKIPVVFLSAKGQESEVNTGMEAGAVEYILKPFSPDELMERVGIILNHNGR
jgi:DNA-binding response OmpR family regulator